MLNKHNYEIDFINSLLFRKNPKKNIDFLKLDYEFIITYCSSHLLLPAFHHKSLEKEFTVHYPSDFSQYCSKIYKINLNRNKLLIAELKFIFKVFEKNKLNYALLKGGALILNRVIHPAERMIGDIDILVSNHDEKKAIKILNDLDYISKYEYKYWKTNVHPNFINKNKIFAVDLHNDLLPKKYSKFLNSSEILKRTHKTSYGIKTLCIKDMILNTIYNYQICDYGTLKVNYSLRKIYDYYNLKKCMIKEIKPLDIHINSFFYFTNQVSNNKDQVNKDMNLDLIILIAKYIKPNKKLNKTYISICNLFVESKNIYNKIIEFIFNQKYRTYALNKLGLFQKKF